jgi:GDP-mannose 6-dehydrogenase
VGFGVCFQPEFLREGSSIKDYDNPPFTVVGASSERDVAPLREVFGHLPCGFMVCGIRAAEMLKYACNAFHALKITFANEIGRVCQAVDVDPHQVMDLVCADTRLNISRAYLRPGFAYGGSCLPKDLGALRHLASQNDVAIPMLSAVSHSNQIHLEHAVSMVLATGHRSVAMIGLSFKSGTDDLRESPLVAMAERFIGKGLRLRIYDPHVNLSRLLGANRRYIEETIPHIGSLMTDDLPSMIDDAQVLVVGQGSETVLTHLRQRCRPGHFILDLAKIPDPERLAGTYRGICW